MARYTLWDGHGIREVADTDDRGEVLVWLKAIDDLPDGLELAVEDAKGGWYASTDDWVHNRPRTDLF